MSRQRITRGAAVGCVLALALSLLLVTGCGGNSSSSSTASPGGSGTLTLWHGYTDIERTGVEHEVAAYNATSPAWKVNAVFSGNNDFVLQKLLTSLAAGKAPDITYQYGSSMANLVRSPKLVDLTPFINDTPSFNWNDFFPAVRLAATVNGKVMGIPALVDNLALVYNKKLFNQAGVPYPTAQWTWSDFENAARKLTIPSQKQFGWAYVADGSEDTVWRYIALLWQAGGDLLTPDNTKAAFNSPAGLKAMTLLSDLTRPHTIYLDNGNGNYLNLFNANKIAMLWTGPWDISSINSNIDFGVQILPGDVSHATIAGPDNWVLIDNGADRVNGAWKFMTWFLSPEEHLKFCIATGDLPLRTSETKLPDYQGVYLKKYPAEALFVQNLSNVTKARPNIPTYPKISSDLGQAIQAVLLGKLTPQQALTQAEQQVNADITAGQ